MVDVGEDEHITLQSPCTVHPVQTVGPLQGPQELNPAEGLQVRFDADELGDVHPIPAPAEFVAFGATELPAQDWPTQIGAEWTPLRAWTLAVWDMEATDGFSVTAELEQALPTSTEVTWFVADYLYGFREGALLEEAAQLSSDGKFVSTSQNGGLDRTTLWMVAAKL